MAFATSERRQPQGHKFGLDARQVLATERQVGGEVGGAVPVGRVGNIRRPHLHDLAGVAGDARPDRQEAQQELVEINGSGGGWRMLGHDNLVERPCAYPPMKR